MLDVQHCLQHYLASATLPTMIPGIRLPPTIVAGHRSHFNVLSTRPSPHRRLESMPVLNESIFDSYVDDFTQLNVPMYATGAIDMDPITREAVTVPNEPDFCVKSMPLEDPHSLEDLQLWLHFLPLKTVQRIIHFIFPETRQYRAALRGFNDVDRLIFQYIKWGIHDPTQIDPDIGDPTPSLVIVVQPPWILIPEDLEYFVHCGQFPSFDVNGDNSPFRSKERLWAKIWDLCVGKNCPWFVLTTYWGWVFGAFSKGWTRAFISPIKQYSDKGPTVLECLVYWICSSMELPGGYKIPEVSELVEYVMHPVAIPAPSTLSTPAPSRSWSNDSADLEHDSDCDSRSDHTVGPIAGPIHPARLAFAQERTQKIETWRTDPLGYNMQLPENWRALSPALSDFSDSSTSSTASTVRGFGDQQRFQKGDWLTGNPGEAFPPRLYVH